MSEKENNDALIGIGLGALGLITIIAAQAVHIASLDKQILKKDKLVKNLRRRYEKALNLMTVEQLSQTLDHVIEDFKFEEVIKNFK